MLFRSIRHLLNCVTVGGKVAVIVPVSAMIGKTKEDKQVKKEILKNHTLEGVISLNKDTFYRVGTVPCIAVFSTGEPHPKEKLVKFINFENDGFEVKKHLGLVETERARDRKQFLLDCWKGKVKEFPSSFMVETTVEDTDEWLHSFYYYNDEIPTEEVEKQLKGYLGIGVKVKGRLDGTLSQDGELNPDSVARAVGKENKSEFGIPSVVEMRPPALCEGCGHRDMYITLTEVLKEEYPSHKVFSDIGCYTLGANAPFNAINSCVDMGASITMAKGAADGGLFPAVAVIGDSTFTHSGMTGLLDCVNENASVTIVISDNETTAMTGGQDSAGTGRIEAICAGIGVDPAHIRVVTPLKKNYEEMKQIIREEIEYRGVSVIIPRRECIQTLARKKRSK